MTNSTAENENYKMLVLNTNKKPDVIKAALSVGKPLPEEFIRKLVVIDNVYAKEIWNAAIEQVAIDLKLWYPENISTNAFCAAIRSMKKWLID